MMSIISARWGLSLALVLAATIPVSTVHAQAQETSEGARIVRVYPVYDLILPTRNYPYPSHQLPTVGEQGVSLEHTSQFGILGGMGGVGGGGMGGGMFAVPDQVRTPSNGVLSQFGGGGATRSAGQAFGGPAPFSGASGGYGAGMGFSGGRSAAHRPPGPVGNPLHFSIDELISVITSVVIPDSWDAVGGAGSISAIGGSLVVANSSAAHKQIEALLESLREVGAMHRSVVIEAFWLQLTSNQLSTLAQGQSTGLVNSDQLKQLIETTSLRFRGQISCLNGQTVYAVSGDRHSAITSAIPVVGSGIGYQSIHEIPNSGVLLQTTSLVLPDSDVALIDVQSTVTEWREVVPRRLDTIEIDCPVIAAQQLATTIRIKLGTAQLVGGLTVVETKTPPAESGQKEQPQLYLMLRVDSPKDVD